LNKCPKHPIVQLPNIALDEYNTNEKNTGMSLGSESNNESSYAEIFKDYSPPSY
jgi:hypothetical protein